MELKSRRAGAGEVFGISSARESLSDDIRVRQRNYAISMAVRTVCVILAATLWHVQTVVAACALVGGLLLPWVAVTIANGGRSNRTHHTPAFVPGPTRNVLEPGPGTRAVGDPPPRDDEGDLPDHSRPF